MNTKEIGNLTELQCITRLYQLGCSVSIPYGNSEKYDLIIDWNNKLYKIQVKHANIKTENNQDTHLELNCRWQGHNSKGYTQNKYTANDTDFFATFYNGNCYLIPQSECSNIKTLRIVPPKNGQIKGISFLKNYLAQEVLKQL